MSGRPRHRVIDESKVGVYHVWNRCVRKLFLFGRDKHSGNDYSSCKAWLQQRLEELCSSYAIDACVWAVLSNHFHLIVRNRPDLVAQWSDEEVVIRWWYLHPERREEDGRPAIPTPTEIRSIIAEPGRVEKLRARLSSISWFMKELSEWISRRVNARDKQSGHLWQDRFGCRSLLDEPAILVCSIYIDINEYRAGLAASLADSLNNSAYLRKLARLLRLERAAVEGEVRPPIELDYQLQDPDYWMCPLDIQDRSPLLGVPGTPAATQPWIPQEIAQIDGATISKQWRHGFLPMGVDKYLEILEHTVRGLAEDGRQAARQSLEPLLKQQGIQVAAWFKMLDEFETWFHGAVGAAERLMEFAARTGRAWVQGLTHCRECFG